MADTLRTPAATGQTATAPALRAAIPEHPDGGCWSDPMQPEPLTPTRPRRGRRALAPVLALLLAGAATACAQEAGGGLDARTGGSPDGGSTPFAATADYLASAVDNSQAQPYRFQMGMDMGVGPIQAEVPDLATGQRDGDRSSLRMDMGGLYEDMGVPGLDGDLTMEMVTDGKHLFVRAPVFKTLAELPGAAGATGPMGALADLGDRWGRVDIAALGDTSATSRLLNKAGVQNGDPTVMLDLVKQADDVHELGNGTSRGDAVQGLGATLTFEDMLEAQGLDVDDYFGSMSSSLPPGADTIFDRMRDLELPVEVWVDGDDHVRRIELTIDMGDLLGEFADTEGVGDFAVTSSMELYDYGDDSIHVDLPADAVDVTDEFRSGLES
jgi:hypothetical protein